ncbi:hypothetical protein Bbelb_413880 [Branchiostoma belcheri]|nr:hypothetical protein Bbelb_413880 [Branchiostoma belcheri]
MFHTLQTEGQRNEQTLLNWLRPPVSDRYLDQKDTNCLTYITKPACRLTRNTTAKQNHPYLHGRSPTTVVFKPSDFHQKQDDLLSLFVAILARIVDTDSPSKRKTQAD